jgi:DNA modification methylase
MNIEEFENKIIHADCMDILKHLPDKCIDLVLTDIPYGVVNRQDNGLRKLDKGCADTVSFSLKELVKELIRINKGSIYIFCGTEQISEIRKILVDADYSTRLIIWEKTNPSPMNGETIWLSGIECCVYGKRGGAVFNEKCKNTVLRYPICNDKFKFHTTQKPLKMFEYLVNVSSNENDLILDCFSGSGTTAIACHNLNRRFICIEKDYDYWKASVERLENAKAQLKLF